MDELTQTAISKKFRIIGPLGDDWFGNRYEAQRVDNGRRVLLKVMSRELSKTPRTATNLYQNLKKASLVSHTNLAKLFTVDKTDQDVVFYAQEFLGNASLRSKLKHTSKYSVLDALGIMTQILTALRAIHKLKLIHGYLTPSNIFFVKRINGKSIVKLSDYAVVDIQEFIKHAGIVKNYLSPEQALGEEVWDSRTDVFSSGAIFYELLSGKRAFEAIGDEDVSLKIIIKSPPPLEKIAKDVPKDIVSIVNRALANDCDCRYQDIGDFLKDVVAYQKRLSDKPNPSQVERTLKKNARAKPVSSKKPVPLVTVGSKPKKTQTPTVQSLAPKDILPKEPIKKTEPIVIASAKTEKSQHVAKATTPRVSSKKIKPEKPPQITVPAKVQVPPPLHSSPHVFIGTPTTEEPETVQTLPDDWLDDLDVAIQEIQLPMADGETRKETPTKTASAQAPAAAAVMSKPPVSPPAVGPQASIPLSVDAQDDIMRDMAHGKDDLRVANDVSPHVLFESAQEGSSPRPLETVQEDLFFAQMESVPPAKSASRASFKAVIRSLIGFISAKIANRRSFLGTAENGLAFASSTVKERCKRSAATLVLKSKHLLPSKKHRIIAGAVTGTALVLCLLVIGLFSLEVSLLNNHSKKGSSSSANPYSMEAEKRTPPLQGVLEKGLAETIDATEKEQAEVVGTKTEAVQDVALAATPDKELADRVEEMPDRKEESVIGGQVEADGKSDHPLKEYPSHHFKKKQKEKISLESWATNPFKKE
jgi:serine/threonine protein kinase